MKTILIISSLALLFMSNQAYALDPYIGVTIGSPLTSVNSISDTSGSLKTDFKPGYMGAVTAGLAFDSEFRRDISRTRIEAEFGYQTNELSKIKNASGGSASADGTVKVTNLMMNICFENNLLSKGTNVFLLVGAGAATASVNTISYQGTTLIKESKNTQFAYQGGVGTGIDVTKGITLEVGYKYLRTTSLKFSGVTADYGSHNILFGVRYTYR